MNIDKEREAFEVWAARQPAVPSDKDILTIADQVHQTGWCFDGVPDGLLVDFARALLSRYGRPAGDAQSVAAQETYPQMMPVELSQFLFDVMTAAGLVSHGKQCKALGERLGDACMRLRRHYPEPFAAPVAAGDAQPVAWIRKNGFRFNADIEPQDDNEIPLYAAPVAAQKADDADPLQGAANWLVNALAKPRPTEIAARLLIGYNRAERLFDAAMSQQRQEGKE